MRDFHFVSSKLLIVSAIAFSLTACAKTADEVRPAYVSPIAYESLSCKQLAAEAQRVSYRASVLAGVQDDKATDDAIATTAAIVVFWPAAFLIEGNDHDTAELARLKGEFEAIEEIAAKKNCGLDFRRERRSGV